MTPPEIASFVVSAANAIAAITTAAGVWYGIRAMIRSNEDRAEQQRETSKKQREADERRHAEAMQEVRPTRAARSKPASPALSARAPRSKNWFAAPRPSRSDLPNDCGTRRRRIAGPPVTTLLRFDLTGGILGRICVARRPETGPNLDSG